MGSLSTENVGDLAAGVSAGANVYELMLFLEESPAIGEAIVAWLTIETKIISNRTALTNGESWFDFLILSQHSPEAVREALLSLDPQRQCVKSLRHVGGELLLDGEQDEGVANARPAVVDGRTAPGSAQGRADSRNSTVLRVRSDVIDRFMTRIGEIRIVAAELAEATAAPDGIPAGRDSARPPSWPASSKPTCGGCRQRRSSCASCRSTPSWPAFRESCARWPRSRARMSGWCWRAATCRSTRARSSCWSIR